MTGGDRSASYGVVQEIVAAAEQLISASSSRALLGITGPPGAGKSTAALAVVERTVARWGTGAAAYVAMDGFHLANRQLERLGLRGRKGAPETFDSWGFAALIARIADGRQEVFAPDFDRALDEPVAGALRISGEERVVVVEGNYLALDRDGWAAARRWFDAVWYLDVPADVRRPRLVARHVSGGRDQASAEAYARDVDEANADLVALTRSRCERTFRP